MGNASNCCVIYWELCTETYGLLGYPCIYQIQNRQSNERKKPFVTESISQQHVLVATRQRENWQRDVNVRPT